MHAVKKLVVLVTLAALAGQWGQTAAAQFEIAPDHFKDWPDSVSQSKLATTFDVDQDQIAAAQRELDECQALLASQQAAVEQARETAVGAGAMGDLASIYLDQQDNEVLRLQSLQRELAPRMTLARAIIQGAQPSRDVAQAATPHQP